jgi:RNA polymerase sigma-B factor
MTISVAVKHRLPSANRVTNLEPRPAPAHGAPPNCRCGRTGCHDDFRAMAATSDPAARTTLHDRIFTSHLDLAYGIASRYRIIGSAFQDVRQVAALALVEAVNRFDPGLNSAFSAFAAPTITGAVKRHFRDQRWMVHPPRRIKDLRLRIRAATDLLTQQLGRVATVTDIADHLSCSPREVSEALCTENALQPLSIDAPVRATDETLSANLGGPDVGYAQIDNVETLRPLLAALSERELRVITLRFADNLTQAQIGELVGCSQMQISRIIRRALDRLRRELQDRPDRGADAAHHRSSAG